MPLASFPSPDRSVWDLGPIPLRAYALCIIAGIIVAIWLSERRWIARGGKQGTVSDIAVWAVIFGLVGGRLYHVITDNELYFRAGKDPWRAFYVWEGGLGIWGAVALGGLGAWIGCRRRGITLPPFADAAAPGIVLAQGIGRLGNYFNQELFGKPTDLPWAVEIDPDKPSTIAGVSTYHPTFLYELLWDVGLAGVLIWADRRFTLGRGRVFALYVMGYTLGRVWIEMLRIDSANHFLGVRLNVWTSIVVFAGGLAYFLLHRGPRETEVEPGGPTPTPGDGTATATDGDADESPDAPVEAATPAIAAPAGSAADDDAPAKTPTAEPTAEPAADAPAEATTNSPVAAAAVVADDRPDDDAPVEAAAAADDRPDDDAPVAVAPAAGDGVPAGATAAAAGEEPTAEERVAAAESTTDEPMTVERRRRLLPAGRRKR